MNNFKYAVAILNMETGFEKVIKKFLSKNKAKELEKQVEKTLEQEEEVIVYPHFVRN